jgi:membrane-associated phospholipid phosphatase
MSSINDWLAMHPVLGFGASVYYIVLHGLVVGVVGLLLIWRRVPSFGLHRNALIASSSIALVVFVVYPVAPPRMLPGYHDVAASASPLFDKLLDGRAADQFASLPSLHVTWALWVAIAASALLRRPLLRALAWIYPALTVLDVLATGNHYLLDVITAPGVVLLAYAIAGLLALCRRRLAERQAAHRHAGGPPDLRQVRPGAGPVVTGRAAGPAVVRSGRTGLPLARRRASDAHLPALPA